MSTPTTPITPYATSPSLSVAYEERDTFLPIQETSEPWSPPQAKVIKDTSLSRNANQPWGHPVHGLPVFNTGCYSDSPIPETPAQPVQGTEDCKYPPHILERMGNYQQSPKPEIYYDPYPGLWLRYLVPFKLYSDMEKEHNNKMKDKEEVVDKLQRVVDEQDEKIKMFEKKERARLYKGHVRKGEKPFWP